jgi:uncharacterized membrane protein
LSDISLELTEKEKSFLVRTAKRKKLFLTSSVLSVLVAVVFVVYHGLIVGDLNAMRFVIVILLLLSGRSHLRQYKSALIFNKLKSRLGD